MIAEKIYLGHTAAQIGISADNYQQRKATLDRYLQHSDGGFDPAGYLAWLGTDQEGDRGENWTPDQPSRGLGDTVAKITSAVGIKPCGGCKQRQKDWNKIFPYKNKTERV